MHRTVTHMNRPLEGSRATTSSSSAITSRIGEWATLLVNAPLLRFVVVLQQPHRFSKAERLHAWVQAGALALCSVALAALVYSPVMAWLLACVMQLFSVGSTSFVLFVLMEYEDRTSEGADAERLTRPVLNAQLWTRWVQVVHTWLLMNWWTAILCVMPQIPLDLYLRSRNELEPDATTLWKHVRTLQWWTKAKLVYQAVVTIVISAQMVVALIVYFLMG